MADLMLLCSEEAIQDCPDYSGIRFGHKVDANEVAFICGAGKEGIAIYLHRSISLSKHDRKRIWVQNLTTAK